MPPDTGGRARGRLVGRRGNGRKEAKQRATSTHLARVQAYLIRHLQVLFYSIGQLSRTPVSTLMTASVIGIALALPMGLHVLLQNVHHVTQNWNSGAQMSLFLKRDTPPARARALAQELRATPEVASVASIDREDALEEFRRNSGFGQALDALEENPLPAVIVVYPTRAEPAAVDALLTRFAALPEVELAQLDMQWVKRLYAIMEIGRRAVWVLGALLALSVLLIVGNTIRLTIHNRREEIEVIKLIGGTDGFIRRPFLYTGLWYGLAGGLIACLLVSIALWLLSGPVNRLSSLYESGYQLATLDPETILALLGLSVTLGLLGSWLAVGRHLDAIEPV